MKIFFNEIVLKIVKLIIDFMIKQAGPLGPHMRPRGSSNRLSSQKSIATKPLREQRYFPLDGASRRNIANFQFFGHNLVKNGNFYSLKKKCASCWEHITQSVKVSLNSVNPSLRSDVPHQKSQKFTNFWGGSWPVIW